jgi:SAM-dependent methyltransferase
MDTFFASLKVGRHGKVIGVDMTDEQLDKANRLRDLYQFTNVTYLKGYIEDVPYPPASVDAVISNGVINLAVDKTKVFRQVYRLLKSGGRLAISDIVTEVQLPENIVCNSTLWAACIGGAAQQQSYRDQIELRACGLTRSRKIPPISSFPIMRGAQASSASKAFRCSHSNRECRTATRRDARLAYRRESARSPSPPGCSGAQFQRCAIRASVFRIVDPTCSALTVGAASRSSRRNCPTRTRHSLSLSPPSVRA